MTLLLIRGDRFRCNTKHAAKFGFQMKSDTTHCQLSKYMRFKTSQTYLLTVETCHILTSEQRLCLVMKHSSLLCGFAWSMHDRTRIAVMVLV